MYARKTCHTFRYLSAVDSCTAALRCRLLPLLTLSPHVAFACMPLHLADGLRTDVPHIEVPRVEIQVARQKPGEEKTNEGNDSESPLGWCRLQSQATTTAMYATAMRATNEVRERIKLYDAGVSK